MATSAQIIPAFDQSDSWAALVQLVTNGLTSPESRRAYARALHRFLHWYRSEAGGQLNKALVQQYRAELQKLDYAPPAVNLHLSAIRKLAGEAADNGFMDVHLAAGIGRVRGCAVRGRRLGNWLDGCQAKVLIQTPDATTLRGRRDTAVLASAIGCGLRREELSGLTFEHIQQRESRCVIVDLIGKGGRMRSVPVPVWVKQRIDSWGEAAGIAAGPVFRGIDKKGRLRPGRMSSQAIYNIVKGYGYDIGTCIAPHDLRRTFAKLAHTADAPIEQIQLSLGHASISTTERYLGVSQDLRRGPGDYIRLPGIDEDGSSVKITTPSTE